jgi:hypothetical protein
MPRRRAVSEILSLRGRPVDDFPFQRLEACRATTQRRSSVALYLIARCLNIVCVGGLRDRCGSGQGTSTPGDAQRATIAQELQQFCNDSIATQSLGPLPRSTRGIALFGIDVADLQGSDLRGSQATLGARLVFGLEPVSENAAFPRWLFRICEIGPSRRRAVAV